MNTTSKMQQIAGAALRFWFREQIIENFRPSWLKGLELDFFIPALNIGFEVQGEQHRRFVPCFHKSADDFDAQVARDKLKKKLCDEHGTKLIKFNTLRGMKGALEKAIPFTVFGELPLAIQDKIKKYHDFASKIIKERKEYEESKVYKQTPRPATKKTKKKASLFQSIDSEATKFHIEKLTEAKLFLLDNGWESTFDFVPGWPPHLLVGHQIRIRFDSETKRFYATCNDLNVWHTSAKELCIYLMETMWLK